MITNPTEKQGEQDIATELTNSTHKVLDQTKRAAAATDHYVHENPWIAVGIAAVLGMAVGCLIGRSGRGA